VTKSRLWIEPRGHSPRVWQTDGWTDAQTKFTITKTAQRIASRGKNRLLFGEDMDKSLVACFLTHGVGWNRRHNLSYITTAMTVSQRTEDGAYSGVNARSRLGDEAPKGGEVWGGRVPYQHPSPTPLLGDGHGECSLPRKCIVLWSRNGIFGWILNLMC